MAIDFVSPRDNQRPMFICFCFPTLQVKEGTVLPRPAPGSLVHTPWRRRRIKQVFNRA